MQIFTLPQQLEVPLFQRPYVWDEQSRWAPLWHDVRRLIELRMRDPLAQTTHFLGAIVMQAHELQIGHLPVNNIIDGQQRLGDPASEGFTARADGLVSALLNGLQLVAINLSAISRPR